MSINVLIIFGGNTMIVYIYVCVCMFVGCVALDVIWTVTEQHNVRHSTITKVA